MSYGSPSRVCDLVLKGGTTSGVLYPSAICKFAEKFELISLGGTSAGALASAAAAAAEFRRRNGSPQGYEDLANLPNELSVEGRLRALFTPEKSTRKLFKLLEKFLQEGKDVSKFKIFWLFVSGKLSRWERAWTKNGMGCCTGMALDGMSSDSASEGWQSITPWLAGYIDSLSGVSDRPSNSPLTFGDLWDAPRPQSLDPNIQLERSIDARFVSTNLTFGKPTEIPFTSNLFGFKPDEWRKLFPSYVVDYMERNPGPATVFNDIPGVVPLPAQEHLPVIVAARMSMSLPGIFTAVPMVAIDYQRDPNAARDVWFSDGGVTSNLPIHRFDALLPRWPTLAINLQYAKEPGKFARRNVVNHIYLPNRRSDGSRSLWTGVSDLKGLWEGKKKFSGIGAFLGSILSSALRWHDNSYLVLPGFKGRVAEIWLDPDEGGDNWDMKPETVRELVARGEKAADRLTKRIFEDDDTNAYSWNDQRWRRFRTVMAGLSDWLKPLVNAKDSTTNGNRTLDDLIQSPPKHPVNQQKIKESLKALVKFSEEVQDDTIWNKKETTPKPNVEIGTRAPMTAE